MSDQPPRFPVIVEHLVTDKGKTLCTGHAWTTVTDLQKTPRYFCPLCQWFTIKGEETP